MAVIIGSARIAENGTAFSDKRGDQTGKEVSTQNWYKHDKGWVMLRAKNYDKAKKIAQAMKAACSNNLIGYSQGGNRETLRNHVKSLNYDPSRASIPVDCDCSSLVRVCCNFADIYPENFTTPTQANVMLKTGEFTKYTESKYTTSSDYLRIGDVLVTKTSGHTVVVLSDGLKAHSDTEQEQNANGSGETRPILERGDSGKFVEELQMLLIWNGFDLPRYGVDSDFGAETENVVKAFQVANKLTVDGVVGEKTWKALLESKANVTPEQPVTPVAPNEFNCNILLSGYKGKPISKEVAKRFDEKLGKQGFTSTVQKA